jgi:hypothetical protein
VELSKKSQQEIEKEAQKQKQLDSGAPNQEREKDRDKDKDNNSDFNFAEFVRLKHENRLLKTQLAGLPAGIGGSIPHPGPTGTRFKSPMLPSIHASGGGGGNSSNNSSNSSNSSLGVAQSGGCGGSRR